MAVREWQIKRIGGSLNEELCTRVTHSEANGTALLYSYVKFYDDRGRILMIAIENQKVVLDRRPPCLMGME